MEIEPEVIDPKGRPYSTPLKGMKKWQLLLLKITALALGIVFLFFMFWAALIFLGLGILYLIVLRIRSWFTGKPPPSSSTNSVRFYIHRGPPSP